MTTQMTEQQFKDWAAATAFTFSEQIEGHTEIAKTVDHDDETGAPIDAPYAYATAWKTASATLPDGSAFEATFQTGVEWPGTEHERHSDSFKPFDSEYFEPFIMSGVTLIDEDGDAIEYFGEDMRIVCEAIEGLNEINFESLIPAVTTTDIDIDEDSTMETITLENDNEPAIRFTGELVAKTSSSPDRASGYHSGSTGRWTTLKLYKTKSGRFVAQSIGHTQWQGEHDRYKAAVCENEAAVIAFFGHGWLAKDLYEEAGIEDVTEVE